MSMPHPDTDVLQAGVLEAGTRTRARQHHTLAPLTQPQKKFIDAVNGKSGLTFFEALESEV